MSFQSYKYFNRIFPTDLFVWKRFGSSDFSEKDQVETGGKDVAVCETDVDSEEK